MRYFQLNPNSIEFSDKHFTIQGFRIVVKQAENGCYVKAFNLDNPKIDPFIEQLFHHLAPTNNETTVLRMLETAVSGYKNSL